MLVGGGEDRGGDGMLGAGLDGGCQPEDLTGAPPVGGDDRGDGQVARGQGAGLVEHHGVDGADRFQGPVALEEDAQLGAAS